MAMSDSLTHSSKLPASRAAMASRYICEVEVYMVAIGGMAMILRFMAKRMEFNCSRLLWQEGPKSEDRLAGL